MQLSEIVQRAIDVLCPHQILNKIVGDLLGRRRGSGRVFGFPGVEIGGRQRGVVVRKGFDLRGRPAPVFEHLARRFDKVLHGARAVEARVFGAGDEVVDAVAEFCEGWCKFGSLGDEGSVLFERAN